MIAQQTNQTVVHLVAPPSSQADSLSHGRILPAVLCALALRANKVPQGRVILVGDHTVLKSAAALGLHADARIAPVFHNPRFMARNLQSLLAPNTHIMCWSDELFASASAICPTAELISTAPSLMTKAPRGHTMIRVLDEHERDHWSDRNRNAILDRDLCALVDTHRPTHTRQLIRDHLGLDDRTICIGALSDCPSSTDARQFAFTLGLFASAGYTLAGLLPSAAQNFSTARRHQRGLRDPFRLIFCHDPIVSLLPAIDILFHHDHNKTGGASLLERLCENADVPVVRLSKMTKQELVHSSNIAKSILDQLDSIVHAQPAP